MDHRRVKTFRKKLENLSISDYHGLNSPGLTCYLNSVLQVLFMTEDFREAVKSSKDPATIDLHLGLLFNGLEKEKSKTHHITKILDITDVYEQRDAAEYFEKILCQTSPEASKIFKGELNHETTCCKCGKSSDSKNLFWILPLAMNAWNSKTYNVLQGLKSFFKVQKVCGDNQMYCESCKDKQDAVIKCQVTQRPDVLTLLLKRFTFDNKQNCYVKLHCSADVAHNLYIENCMYHLYAVVHHVGDLTGGHYTADIKSFETGRWYRFDDSVVKRVKQQLFTIEDTSFSRFCTAYLLMYRKVSEQPKKTDVSNPEAHSDDEAAERRDRAEQVSHHRLKSESCRGKNKRLLNGEALNGECKYEKQVDITTKTGTRTLLPGVHSTRNTVKPAQTSDVNNHMQAGENVGKQGITFDFCIDPLDSNVRSSWNYSLTVPLQNCFEVTKFNSLPDQAIISSRIKGMKEKTLLNVTAENGYKLEASQAVTRGKTKWKNYERIKDKEKKKPWK